MSRQSILLQSMPCFASFLLLLLSTSAEGMEPNTQAIALAHKQKQDQLQKLMQEYRESNPRSPIENQQLFKDLASKIVVIFKSDPADQNFIEASIYGGSEGLRDFFFDNLPYFSPSNKRCLYASEPLFSTYKVNHSRIISGILEFILQVPSLRQLASNKIAKLAADELFLHKDDALPPLNHMANNRNLFSTPGLPPLFLIWLGCHIECMLPSDELTDCASELSRYLTNSCTMLNHGPQKWASTILKDYIKDAYPYFVKEVSPKFNQEGCRFDSTRETARANISSISKKFHEIIGSHVTIISSEELNQLREDQKELRALKKAAQQQLQKTDNDTAVSQSN